MTHFGDSQILKNNKKSHQSENRKKDEKRVKHQPSNHVFQDESIHFHECREKQKHLYTRPVAVRPATLPHLRLSTLGSTNLQKKRKKNVGKKTEFQLN
jgi:hypothetical protein